MTSSNIITIENQDALNAALAERPIDNHTTYGVITRNDHTEQHGATLQELGYEVVASEDSFAIQGRFLRAKKTDVVDISTLPKAVGFIRAVVANKRLINYGQRFKLPNGKVLFRGPVLSMLGHKTMQDALGFDPTALIAKKGKVQAPKKKVDDPWAVTTPETPASSNDPFAAATQNADPFATNDPFAV